MPRDRVALPGRRGDVLYKEFRDRRANTEQDSRNDHVCQGFLIHLQTKYIQSWFIFQLCGINKIRAGPLEAIDETLIEAKPWVPVSSTGMTILGRDDDSWWDDD